jgi:hypothetical protein
MANLGSIGYSLLSCWPWCRQNRSPWGRALSHSFIRRAPPLATRGLAARLYASIAPDAPHALHMPSHIFTRVGAWEDSASTNRRSYEAAIKGGELPEAYHASDYAVYADLQLARDAAALSAMEDAFKVKAAPTSQVAVAYSSAAMPARDGGRPVVESTGG